MRQVKLAIIISGLAIILQPAIYKVSAADICDDQKGEAYGLCLAAMSIPCNLNAATDPVCETLAESFHAVTQAPPPWLDNTQQAICPCQLEIDQLIGRLKDESIEIDGECTIGQLTTNVPVPDSMGIQVTGKGISDSLTLIIGAYAYRDTDGGSGQCEVEGYLGPDQQISTALMITRAEQEQCERAIKIAAPLFNIVCFDRSHDR